MVSSPGADAAPHGAMDADSPLGMAIALLNTPPPDVDEALAAALAARHYGLAPPATPLVGERDRNFHFASPHGGAVVLKCINRTETAQETAMQIAVLRHLAVREPGVPVPRHIPALNGADLVRDAIVRDATVRDATVRDATVRDATVRDADASGGPLRLRAYSFLEGRPATQVPGSAALRRSLGRASAGLDRELADFHDDTLRQRVILWDLMQLVPLRPLVRYIDDAGLQAMARHYLDAFEQGVAPAAGELPWQATHNDLSKSNFIIDPHDDTAVAGVLDFGDIAFAPRVCDLAVAASYQAGDADDPLAAVLDVAEGYRSVLPLSAAEEDLLLDLVLARAVLRVLLTQWRAALFPDNRAYILRHTQQARQLVARLHPVWRARSRHAAPHAWAPAAGLAAAGLPADTRPAP